MTGKPKALGAHVYAGGFTLGVLRHFDVVGQLEEINLGYRTAELNFPRMVHPKSRERWDSTLDDLPSEIELFYGNPPCAPWSTASRGAGEGRGTGRTTSGGADDERLVFTKTVQETGLRVAPTGAFILETVARGWSDPAGRALYTAYAEEWNRRGYAVTMLVTDAILHGLPSMRNRAHFIAHRYELPLVVPTPPHPLATLRDVIGDLEDLGPGIIANHDPKPFAERYALVSRELAQGEHWHDARDRAATLHPDADVAKGSITLRRLWMDRPSLTVVGADQFVHPTRDRFITVREMARLSGFPDDFVFTDKNVKGSEVGRGVTPVMGEYLAKLVMGSLDAGRPAAATLRVVDWTALARPLSPGRQR